MKKRWPSIVLPEQLLATEEFHYISLAAIYILSGLAEVLEFFLIFIVHKAVDLKIHWPFCKLHSFCKYLVAYVRRF